jgi:hypothetical protein
LKTASGCTSYRKAKSDGNWTKLDYHFLLLPIGLFAIRITAGILVRRQGERYTLDGDAIQKEGQLSVALRCLAFFYSTGPAGYLCFQT